jgi:hypothetical protein
MHPRALTLLLALFLLPTPASAETIALQPLRDNTLFSDPAGALSSGAGHHLFVGNNSVSNTRRGVLAFDIASGVPAGATIDSVTLRLFASSAPNDTPQRITLHRLLNEWGEGTSVSSGGAGAPSANDDATWLHTFYPNRFWSTAGGDFTAPESAESYVGSSGHHAWSSAAMVEDVQHWLDAPEEDFGWLIKGNESAPATVRRFDSRESDTVESRPTLSVHYTPVSTAVEALTWGAYKARYIHSTGRKP